MKVIKPNKLSVLTRCFQHRGARHLGVSVLAFVPLGAPPRLRSEQELWTFVPQRLGPLGVLDESIPKHQGEFLLAGSAHSPDATPVPELPVRASVGPLQKTLLVSGDRFWRGDDPSQARPFTQMPLSWDRAYGGPDFADNPLGRGRVSEAVTGTDAQAVFLPNIEDPHQRIEAPDQQTPPAGFGPMDPSWPQRTRLLGTYDQTWLERDFPGFAADIDWSYFNVAPADQRGAGFWQGPIPYCFEHLHPTRPRLEGTLPALVARAFITRLLEKPTVARRKAEPEIPTRFEAIELSLRTLWFFPDGERAVLIFQGSTPILTDDAGDVRHLVLAAETPEAPRTIEHYAKVLADRLDPQHGALASLHDDELLPAGEDGPDEAAVTHEALTRSQGRLAANMHRRALRMYAQACAELEAEGLDPADYIEAPQPAPEPPSLAELPALAASLLEQAEAKKRELEAEAETLR
ncbi:MAG: DUF2169 domain-containing protein, partial [Myxococcales bacterium]|nr:DUF2169 domain-containing protein [Myxococcales bacterium]